MQVLKSQQENQVQTSAAHAVWQLPFRSFFLTGAAVSVFSISIWLLALMGLMDLSQNPIPSIVWHAHEMIFGFAALIAVGFILTAVQTWTGKPSITGLPVMLLAGTWVAIRLFLFVGTQAAIYTSIVLIFLWWLSVIIIYGRLVFAAKNRRNYLFIPMLSALALLNLLILVSSLNGNHDTSLHLLRSSVLVFTMIIGVVGGRVIPFFTARGTQTKPKSPYQWIEKALLPVSFIGAMVFISSHFIELPFTPAALMIVAGVMHLLRMMNWSSAKTLSVPLLWSLHISYGLMAIGLITLGLSYIISGLTFSAALHLITIGAIGLMILAMISRVSLGHTGRKLSAAPLIVIAFYALIASTLCRFLLSLAGFFIEAWVSSAVLWIISFTFFIFIYWPVLTAPRHT